jgi:hypothetical protein
MKVWEGGGGRGEKVEGAGTGSSSEEVVLGTLAPRASGLSRQRTRKTVFCSHWELLHSVRIDGANDGKAWRE